MKTAAAKAIWSQSISEYKIRYTVLLSNGDNKTIQKLIKSRVYGDKEITTLECVNHIHKKIGTGLEIKGGKSCIIYQYIVKLSTYYKKSIMDFAVQFIDAEDMKSVVDKMENNIIAGLHHSIHNHDPIEQPKFCMDDNTQWC